MKTCADCKNPKACAAAGACSPRPMSMPPKGKGKPAPKKGRPYVKP